MILITCWITLLDDQLPYF